MKKFLIVVGLLACFLTASAAHADSYGVPEEEPLSSRVEHAVKKALAFEVTSSLLETAIFASFYGGAAANFPAIFALTLASSSAIYIAHELSWGQAIKGTASAEDDPDIIAAKAFTYRVASIARSMAFGGLVGGGDVLSSTAFAAVVSAADTALYLGNEVLFSIMGRSAPPAPVLDESIPIGAVRGK